MLASTFNLLRGVAGPLFRIPGRRRSVPLPPREVFDLVLKHGYCSTSFLTLYDGFRYFRGGEGRPGVIAYVETGSAWVAASDPAAPEGAREELLLEFFVAARKSHKAAVMLPASEGLARFARSQGIYAVQVGNEPWFSLDTFGSLHGLGVVRRLISRGGKTEHFDPLKLSAAENEELDELVERWLESRASVPISFLNRVKPWLYLQHKRFFRLRYHERVVGFLSAVPVPGRDSWYLVDLIRSPDAPLGTTELLVADAMEQLKSEGAREITLGMSPLVPVEERERSYHPRLYRTLDLVYRRSDFLYGFQSLFEYKEKFGPTRWEPQYLLAGPKMNLSASLGLFHALFPRGVLLTSLSLAAKKLKAIHFSRIYTSIFSDRIVPRSPPRSLTEILLRGKATLTLAVANVLFFFVAADRDGMRIRPSLGAHNGYSFHRMLANGASLENIKILILSSFLHWNWFHLGFNLAMLLSCGWLLEIVAGSTLLGICYLMGILFSNPLTSITLYPIVDLLDPRFLPAFVRDVDIGCSLGIFACIGMLAHFLRHTDKVIAVLVVLICGTALTQMTLLDLNHIAAMGIGLICGRYYVPKR